MPSNNGSNGDDPINSTVDITRHLSQLPISTAKEGTHPQKEITTEASLQNENTQLKERISLLEREVRALADEIQEMCTKDQSIENIPQHISTTPSS